MISNFGEEIREEEKLIGEFCLFYQLSSWKEIGDYFSLIFFLFFSFT